MILHAFQEIEFKWSNLAKIGEFFLVTLILMSFSIGLACLILYKKFDDAKYRLLAITMALGNVGFFGLPLITALFPNAHIVGCYSSTYTINMTIMSFSVGVFALTKDKQYISLKASLLNTGTISTVIAIIIYITKWHYPTILGNAIKILGNMTTPICMHILGIRLGCISLLELFKRPFAYITCALKLIVFPLFCYLCVYFIPFFDREFKASILILSAVPSAAVVLTLAELHNTEQELTANVVLLSTLICIITIPVISLLLDV